MLSCCSAIRRKSAPVIEFGTPEIALASMVFASAFSPPKHFCTRLPSRTSAMAKVGLAEKHADSETLFNLGSPPPEFVTPPQPPPPTDNMRPAPKAAKMLELFFITEDVRDSAATAIALDSEVAKPKFTSSSFPGEGARRSATRSVCQRLFTVELLSLLPMNTIEPFDAMAMIRSAVLTIVTP